MPQVYFRDVMNQVFFDLLDSCIIVYLDDVLVFSCIKEESCAWISMLFLRGCKRHCSISRSQSMPFI